MKKITFISGIIVLITLNSCHRVQSTEDSEIPLTITNQINSIEDTSFIKYSKIEHGDFVYFITEKKEIKHKYFNNENSGDYYIILLPLFFVYLIIAFILGLLIAKSTN